MNRIYLLGLSALFLFSCTQTPKTETATRSDKQITKTNDLLSSEVVVKDYINLASNDNPDWVKSAVDNKVIKTILDIAIEGKVIVNTVDDGDTIPMTVSEINSNLGMFRDTMQIEISEDTYIDTVITTPAKPEEVEGIFFKENWDFNARDFSFTKHINEYLLVREYYKELENSGVDSSKKAKKLIFKVINDSNSKNFEKIASDVTTAFYFDAELPNFINGLDLTRFANYLINYTYKDKKDVYDFYEQNTKLSYDDAKAVLGASSDTIQLEVTPGNFKETVLNYEPEPAEIIGVIFVENWYLDKETLSLKKDVTGIAPIRRYNDVDPEGETYTRTTIPYLIKL